MRVLSSSAAVALERMHFSTCCFAVILVILIVYLRTWLDMLRKGLLSMVLSIFLMNEDVSVVLYFSLAFLFFCYCCFKSHS